MAIKTKPFDISEHLETDEDIHDFLQEVASIGESSDLVRAIGYVAKAKGMTEISRMTGMSRSSLYESLSGEGSPKFDTIDKVLHALGMGISVEKVAA